MMFHLTRPSPSAIQAFLAAQADASPTYAEVGATRREMAPAGYTVDRNRVALGSGAETFARAVEALHGWRMTDLGWTSVAPAAAPVVAGATVAMVARVFGLWSLNACRIVDVFEEDVDGCRRVGFVNGTLPAHAAVGEERFRVEWNHAGDDQVWYDIYAFSRPAHLLTRLGYPVARLMQRRFGRDSKRAMVDAVHAGKAGA